MVGFAAYSEMLPQSAAVAFVLAKVAVNGAVMECDPVVFMQVGTYLFGTEFAADKGVDVLNQLRIEFIGFSPVLFGQPESKNRLHFSNTYKWNELFRMASFEKSKTRF